MSVKKIGMIAGSLVAVVLVSIGVAAGCRKRAKTAAINEEKTAAQHLALAVALEEVQRVDVAQERSYPGVVQASEESALSFRVSGPLVMVHVQPGGFVKKGEVLMQIDTRDFEDRIQTLEAQLAGAVAMLESAEHDYKRSKELFTEKVVPEAGFDHAKSAFDAAAASVKTLNAQLKIARHSLEDTTLAAPYAGTVTRQRVENHEMIKAGQVVLDFHNIQSLEVVVHVPENKVARCAMNEGWPAWITFPSAPDRKYKAQLKEWCAVADPMTRTYAVTYGLEAPQDALVLPGMSAEVTWAADQDHLGQFTVPFSALSADAEGHSCLWVYNTKTGTAERRVVQTGPMAAASRIVVLDGLAEGEQIVVSGSKLMNEGTCLKSGFGDSGTP